MKTRAYIQGRYAFFGESLAENPHFEGTDEWRDWENGWFDQAFDAAPALAA